MQGSMVDQQSRANWFFNSDLQIGTGPHHVVLCVVTTLLTLEAPYHFSEFNKTNHEQYLHANPN